MVKSIVMPFNWAFLDLIQVIRPIIKSFRLIGFDYTYHFQLFKNGHRWNILDKITITELIYSVFSGKDPGNCKSLKIGKEKKSKINGNGNKQASIWPKWISGCMNAQKQAPSGTFN